MIANIEKVKAQTNYEFDLTSNMWEGLDEFQEVDFNVGDKSIIADVAIYSEKEYVSATHFQPEEYHITIQDVYVTVTDGDCSNEEFKAIVEFIKNI